MSVIVTAHPYRGSFAGLTGPPASA